MSSLHLDNRKPIRRGIARLTVLLCDVGPGHCYELLICGLGEIRRQRTERERERCVIERSRCKVADVVQDVCRLISLMKPKRHIGERTSGETNHDEPRAGGSENDKRDEGENDVDHITSSRASSRPGNTFSR